MLNDTDDVVVDNFANNLKTNLNTVLLIYFCQLRLPYLAVIIFGKLHAMLSIRIMSKNACVRNCNHLKILNTVQQTFFFIKIA